MAGLISLIWPPAKTALARQTFNRREVVEAMAKIEDLIAQIPDERLKKAIAAEVKALKKNKKFGLVFEEHLPETVRLPKLPVKVGELVAKKRESGNELWRVKSIRKGIATLERAIEGYPLSSEKGIEAPVNDLVVVRNFGDPIYPALVPVDRVARGGPGKPWHMVINADNFHALQLLLYAYEGKVDVIYIDPPYNTGARDWKYNNDYVDKTDSFRHSKWLSMMKKRLLLAKRLLKPSGVMVIAIDDCEAHHLRCMIEDGGVLNGDCFLGTVCIRNKPSGNQTEAGLAVSHEYALFYGASSHAIVQERERSEEQMQRFDQSDEHGRFWWENLRRAGANSRRVDRLKMFYPIWVLAGDKIAVPKMTWDGVAKAWCPTEQIPKGAFELFPIRGDGDERIWSWGHQKVKASINDLKIVRDDGGCQIYRKRRMRKAGTMPTTVWVDKRYSATEYGTNMLTALLGRPNAFSFPKSVYTVMECLECASGSPDALILDFFAGSGTTYQATALLNAEDGGNRRCLLVTNNEVGEKTAKELLNQDLFPGDAEYEQSGIAEAVTWTRCCNATIGENKSGSLVGQYLNGREMSEGFEENLEYFRLDFLDPDEVARGDTFKAIVPILWMMAGCRGEREDSKGSTPWFIPKHSSFAVLIQEKQFSAFREKLAERKDIGWVFLITDSEENFGQMRRTLGRKYECVQLYKSYLENFRINTQDALNQ